MFARKYLASLASLFTVLAVLSMPASSALAQSGYHHHVTMHYDEPPHMAPYYGGSGYEPGDQYHVYYRFGNVRLNPGQDTTAYAQFSPDGSKSWVLGYRTRVDRNYLSYPSAYNAGCTHGGGPMTVEPVGGNWDHIQITVDFGDPIDPVDPGETACVELEFEWYGTNYDWRQDYSTSCCGLTAFVGGRYTDPYQNVDWYTNSPVFVMSP